ncbi:hypothetical protein Ahy_A08g039910 [Arachis hypogaea]|uniref:Uncharacterized protein n=1 Tax=Arachis hypogaea TaxID=3818 RepID=A0A445BXP1_ARAHY|nr:hypothetical protein Ahy_A08g039910 [Arachis hypogaea]
MANASNAVGNSNNPRSNGSIASRMTRNRYSHLPDWCGCESRPVLQWLGTDTNSRRLLFGCPNYNTIGKKWYELFLWVDKIQEEHVITFNSRTNPLIDHEE